MNEEGFKRRAKQRKIEKINAMAKMIKKVTQALSEAKQKNIGKLTKILKKDVQWQKFKQRNKLK
jgi:5-bromo-4-chloroindolyl phosphate hydrolysis protein